jgi:diguanylate cyclase (GGDEF)-like protein
LEGYYMTFDLNLAQAPVRDPVALTVVLERSQDVRAKVEECADDLGLANGIVKTKIAEGATTLSAPEALADSERVESKVQACADELHGVNETLAQGINDLKQTEIALTTSRNALAETQASLATAQEDEKRARLRALHDSMTGLPNRDLFDDRLAHAIALAERHNWTLAVMFLDLDHFKSINDTHGHAAGDLILKGVAKRLSQHARDEDTVCRNGGDEFLYLLMNPQGSENIERIAQAVLKDIAQPMDIGHVQLVVKSSVGVAVYPDNGTTGEQLVSHADTAMYHAKKRKSGCAFFDVSPTHSISSEANSGLN